MKLDQHKVVVCPDHFVYSLYIDRFERTNKSLTLFFIRQFGRYKSIGIDKSADHDSV